MTGGDTPIQSGVEKPEFSRKIDVECRDDSTLIAAIAAVFALGVIFWISSRIGGELYWNGDVVNRSVVLGYNKGAEIRLFILSCLLVPGIIGLLVLLYRLQGRLNRIFFVEALIHFPLAVWPFTTLFSPAPIGTVLLVTGVVYCAARLLLMVRYRRFGPRTDRGYPNHEKTDGIQKSNRQRDFIIASLLLGAIGVSTIGSPLLRAGLAPKTVMLISLLSGMLLISLIWLLNTLLITRIVLFKTASLISGLMLLPAALLVFINMQPDNTAIQIGILIISGVLSIGFGGFAILRGTVQKASLLSLTNWIPKLSALMWWIIAPMVLYASVYIHDITEPIDLYHEGERITPAEAIEEGAAPYRDIFLWHGLFENGIKARIGFSIDQTVSGVRRIEHLLEPLELVALYVLLSVCLGSPFLGLVVAVIAGYCLSSPHGRYWLAYLSYASVTLWIVRGRHKHYLAGLGSALATFALFYSLDGGLAAMVALVGALFYAVVILPRTDKYQPVHSVRTIGSIFVGVCAGAIIPLVYLAYNGSVGAWIQATWDIAGGLSDRSSTPYPPLIVGIKTAVRNGFSALPESKIIALYVPPFVILWGLSHLITRRIIGVVKGSMLTLPVIVMGATLFFRAVIRRPDADHLGKILPLIVAITAVLILHHARTLRIRGCHWMYYVSHGLMLMLAVYTMLWIFSLDSETAPAVILRSRSSYHASIVAEDPVRPIQLERAGTGVVANPARAIWLERLVNLLSNRLNPGDTFYDFTNRGLLYYLADRPCPTRYAQTTYAGSKRAQREVIHDLSMRRPKLVVFPSANPLRYAYDQLNHPFRHPLITRYLYRNYLPWVMVGDAIILKRKADTARADRRDALNYIRSHRFSVDIGHIPRLLGEMATESKSIRRWNGKDLVQSWRFASNTAGIADDSDEVSVETAYSGRMTSPRISVVPDPAQMVVIRLRSRFDGDARLQFSSTGHRKLDNSAELAFRIIGDSEIREYHIDVGLLAAWVWRGRITHLRIEFGPETEHVDISSIEIRSYSNEGGI